MRKLTQQEQDIMLESMKTVCKIWIKFEKNDAVTINTLVTLAGYSTEDATTLLDLGKKYYGAFKGEFRDLEVAA